MTHLHRSSQRNPKMRRIFEKTTIEDIDPVASELFDKILSQVASGGSDKNGESGSRNNNRITTFSQFGHQEIPFFSCLFFNFSLRLLYNGDQDSSSQAQTRVQNCFASVAVSIFFFWSFFEPCNPTPLPLRWTCKTKKSGMQESNKQFYPTVS